MIEDSTAPNIQHLRVRILHRRSYIDLRQVNQSMLEYEALSSVDIEHIENLFSFDVVKATCAPSEQTAFLLAPHYVGWESRGKSAKIKVRFKFIVVGNRRKIESYKVKQLSYSGLPLYNIVRPRDYFKIGFSDKSTKSVQTRFVEQTSGSGIFRQVDVGLGYSSKRPPSFDGRYDISEQITATLTLRKSARIIDALRLVDAADHFFCFCFGEFFGSPKVTFKNTDEMKLLMPEPSRIFVSRTWPETPTQDSRHRILVYHSELDGEFLSSLNLFCAHWADIFVLMDLFRDSTREADIRKRIARLANAIDRLFEMPFAQIIPPQERTAITDQAFKNSRSRLLEQIATFGEPDSEFWKRNVLNAVHNRPSLKRKMTLLRDGLEDVFMIPDHIVDLIVKIRNDVSHGRIDFDSDRNPRLLWSARLGAEFIFQYSVLRLLGLRTPVLKMSLSHRQPIKAEFSYLIRNPPPRSVR